jgi:enoyl-CoA hydratase
MSDGHLLVEDVDGIRTITFNRPDAKNALSLAMRNEFCEAVTEGDRDPSVTAIVITGTDPIFTAGVDFKEKNPPSDPRDRAFRVNPGSALRATRTPSICAVNGPCVSGGLEIALSASFVVASDRARFADTHARLNVVPAWGLTALLPRAVGLRKARELSLTGNFVDAAEALRIGLVNHVVPHAELLAYTGQLARDITDAPAAARVLELYEQGLDLGLQAALALEAAEIGKASFDVDAFTKLGRDAAARQRGEN